MTQPITISIAHELGTAEAKRRIAGGFARMIDKVPGGALMKLDERWDGDRMIFEARSLGQTVSGHVDVGDAAVTLVVSLPPLLAGLADKLRGVLRDAGQRLLTKS